MIFCQRPQGPITQHRALTSAFLSFGYLFLKMEGLVGRGALTGLGKPYTQALSVLSFTGILPAVMIIVID